jgi:PAS domain S-box-containing protein
MGQMSTPMANFVAETSSCLLVDGDKTDPSRAWKVDAAFYYSPVGIAYLDRYGVIFRANAAYTRTLGYSEDELVGLHILDITDEADAEQSAAAFRGAWSAGDRPVVFVKRFRHHDGGTIWGRVHLTAINDWERNTAGFISYMEDWTERKREGDRLIETLSFHETAQEFGRVGTFVAWISGANAGHDEWSKECLEIFGYAEGEHDGTNDAFWRRVHPDDLAMVRTAQQAHARGERSYDLSHRIVRPDGEIRWIRERAQVELNADGSPLRFLGVTMDVTDDRKIEEALRASEARFKGAFEHSGIGAVLAGIDGRWIRVNDTAARILGATSDQLIGSRLEDFTFTEDRSLLPSVSGMIAGSKDVESFTLRLRHPLGHPIWINLHLSLIRKADSTLDYILAQMEDITAHRLADAQLQEARVESEAAARVSATMNHEVRGPLNSIIGFTEMLQSGMAGPLNVKQIRYLSNIQTASRSMVDLVTESLDIAKIAGGRMGLDIVSMDLRSELQSALDQVSPAVAAKGSHLVLACPPRLAVLADGRRLRQILGNLLANAVKHTPPETTITVRGLAHDDFVEISVTDTGPGIRPEDLQILFEEFVQVGDDRSGSGLGLAVSRKLAVLMNGQLGATSRVGRGSIFTLTLPRSRPVAIKAAS